MTEEIEYEILYERNLNQKVSYEAGYSMTRECRRQEVKCKAKPERLAVMVVSRPRPRLHGIGVITMPS
jgi:hypothetical protein